MRTASLLMVFLVLLVTDARAQEASIPLSVEGTEQLQRTPALVIHEVVPAAKPAVALKSQGAAAKDAASAAKSSAVASQSPAKPILMSAQYDSASGEIGTTGNPKYDALIVQAAARHGVDPNLIIAVMRQESGFNSRALSYKGASGLMQLMPGTARRFGVTNIFDPVQNIEGGTRYLRFLLDTFNGDVKLVLAGYNAGENAVVNSGYRVPRYRETQNYVRSISARYDAGKSRASAPRPIKVVAPSAETFANGRLSNNY